ncbi:hypothetical protein RB201_00130 [Streptomyces sp. S1A(2023)]
MDTESLFLDLYDSLADHAEYVQSDSSGRNFLSETAITVLTAATLGAFVTGFAQVVGERITQGTADRVRTLLRRSTAEESSTEPAVEALSLLERYLPLLRESTSEQRAAEEEWVARELESRGFPPHVAAAVGADMVARLRAAGDEVDESGTTQ